MLIDLISEGIEKVELEKNLFIWLWWVLVARRDLIP